MTIKPNNVSGNIWKYFIFQLSQRRNFIPILSIFFLTLPNTTAQQIGIYTGIGYLASFIFEIPSGYFADKFGHKRTLIIAKLLMIFSVLAFIYSNSLLPFILRLISFLTNYIRKSKIPLIIYRIHSLSIMIRRKTSKKNILPGKFILYGC